MSILKSVEKKIDIKAGGQDPKEFFKDREGLYIWGSFEDRILPKAEAVKADTEFKLSSFELTERANDEKIESELPEKHIFSESEVCAVIASLIEKQSKGEEGALLNDGNWNLFYTPSRVVRVGWSTRSRGWHVETWGRDDDSWSEGRRVFSPATTSETES